MITIVNRKELTIAFSAAKQASICSTLRERNIPYHVKVINRASPSPMAVGVRARGSYGQRTDLTYEYIIYVKKQDFEQASSLIKRKK